MDVFTISALKRAAQEKSVEAQVHVQVDGCAQKTTRDGKPFWELSVADAEARMTLRAWADSPNFDLCASVTPGEFLEVEGEFSVHPSFGVEARRWSSRALEAEAVEALLGGPKALQEKQAHDFEEITSILATLADPRLNALCGLFLTEFGERFRRTAAARSYHHARRGGLVEHVAQMLRTADRIAELYPALNRDLLLAGVLFHDAGKLWENCPEPRGFAMPYNEMGELIGHITIGIELLNTLWRKLLATEPAREWTPLRPSNEDVRNHLIHLIASHHGEMEFGSPVFPKTPEAAALHYIDNLDAKLEMIFAGYQTGHPLADRIVERVRPLPANLVYPLEKFTAAPSSQSEESESPPAHLPQ
jgi:3'-5' exoribonuclease